MNFKTNCELAGYMYQGKYIKQQRFQFMRIKEVLGLRHEDIYA